MPTSIKTPNEVVYAHGFMSGSLRFEIRNEVKTDSFPVPTVGASQSRHGNEWKENKGTRNATENYFLRLNHERDTFLSCTNNLPLLRYLALDYVRSKGTLSYFLIP